MKLTINKKYDTIVHLVPSDSELEFLSEELAAYAVDTYGFTGKLNETFSHLGPNTENVVIVGLGEPENITRDHYVKAANQAAKTLEANKVNKANVEVKAYGDIDHLLAVQAAAEGLIHAAYSFEKYKSEKSTKSLSEVSLLSDLENLDETINEVVNVLDGVNITRDLVNTPANDLYPETLANQVEELFANTEVEVEIFDRAALKELGAEATYFA